MAFQQVILAVASPPGRSARGIVRISGDRTFDLLRPHLVLEHADNEAAPDERRGRHEGTKARRHEGEWKRGVHRAVLRLLPGELPCLALVFPSPRSYTGEDCLELQAPGNPALLERIIDALLDSARDRGIDARRAEAGEFTARAFLNGRMGLIESEGVAATIAAQSDAELRAARLLSTGKLGRFALRLADELASALALVEAGIDFTDQEHVIPIAPADLLEKLTKLREHIEAQLRRSVGAEQLEAIPWVVLTGDPNAGKSTLFNALLGRERAVVASVAGTTRDVLAEPLTIATDHGPAEVMLVDLAGSGDDDSLLNRRMQAAAREALQHAELVIRCIPIDQPGESPGDAECIVRTKADLVDADDGGTSAGTIVVSAITGRGLEHLRSAIAARLGGRAVSLAGDALALRPRHETALRNAVRSLHEAIELIRPARAERVLPNPELIASAMRTALNELAALAGKVTPDDVLGRIFADFCVGK